MTISISTQEGFTRVLLCLADDVNRGIITSCNVHYETNHIARISVCYLVGHEELSDLPGLPGVTVDDEEEDTLPGKTRRR